MREDIVILNKIRDKYEYEQRHIMPMKMVSSWTPNETAIQISNNRLLQPGYSSFEPEELVEIAKKAKEEWLTDFVCPNAQYACKLNIAADLVVNFKVSSEELNTKTALIYNHITNSEPTFIETIEHSVDVLMSSQEQILKVLYNTQQAMQTKYPHLTKEMPDYYDHIPYVLYAEHEKIKKQILHKTLKHEIKKRLPDIATHFNLQYKRLEIAGDNTDYVFLGAAGSGKSTLLSQFMTEEEKLDYVSLATDDYRGVVLDEKHEKQTTDQIFTRTQDTAYSIKELVQERLESNRSKRPNIILDCITLEEWHRKLLANNKQTISNVACLNDISLVPARAFFRAMDTTSKSADKGRHVNTTALLSGHALASARLLSSIPTNVVTTLYNTNVPKGTTPPTLGSIDTRSSTPKIDVYDLSNLAKFMCKVNVNAEATFAGELYQNKKLPKYQFTFDQHYQAEQIINLAKPLPPYKPDPFDISLKSAQDKPPYATIIVDTDNKLHFKVLDIQQLLSLLNQNKSDAKVLTSIITQIYCKSLDKARENIQTLGTQNAQAMAIEKIVPDIQRVTAYERSNGDNRYYKHREIMPKAQDKNQNYQRQRMYQDLKQKRAAIRQLEKPSTLEPIQPQANRKPPRH